MTEETENKQTERKTNEETAKSREDTSKKPLGVLDKEDTSKKQSNPKEDKDNIIFIGIKPFMNYVTGVVMQFQNKGQDEVIVSARGKFTSKAIDVTEVARRTFLKQENIQIKEIKISSEQFENKEGKRIYVSTIEIHLIRGD